MILGQVPYIFTTHFYTQTLPLTFPQIDTFSQLFPNLDVYDPVASIHTNTGINPSSYTDVFFPHFMCYLNFITLYLPIVFNTF